MDILSVQQLLLDTPSLSSVGQTTTGLGPGAGAVQKPRPRLNVQKAIEYSSATAVGTQSVGEFHKNLLPLPNWVSHTMLNKLFDCCVSLITNQLKSHHKPSSDPCELNQQRRPQPPRPQPPPRVGYCWTIPPMCMATHICIRRPAKICWHSGSTEVITQVRMHFSPNLSPTPAAAPADCIILHSPPAI